MTEPFTFHASVSDDAISKVSRLFNATIDDIFAELFQNARRAGATRILVDRIEDPELGPSIRVCDDGPGVPDFRSLFTLGKSAWGEETQVSEDAAGMGFFSLASRNVRITAQITGSEDSFIFRASPAAFNGKDPIKGENGPDGHRGVEIFFSSPEIENCVSAGNAAAKYFPLPVIVEGAEAERKDFLDGASHVEEWNGIRIGVFHQESTFSRRNDNVNFHGVTLRAGLPSLSQVHHKSYHARLDVTHCANLKMVLPARKELVQDAFFSELKEEIERIFFRQIAAQDAHTLSFKNHGRAEKLGVELPEAEMLLRPFSPGQADFDSMTSNAPVIVTRDALIFEGEDAPVDDQNIAWLIDEEDFPRLFEPCSSFAGYTWYDALCRLEMTGYRLCQDGGIRDIAIGDLPGGSQRYDQLFLIGSLFNETDVQPWLCETDRLVLAPPDAHIDEAQICLTRSSKATFLCLVEHLTRALFSPSHDAEAGSYDNQLQWFTDEAEDLVVVYLESIEDMHRHQTLRTVHRELWWLMKEHTDVTIHIRGREVDVFGLESAFGTKPAEASS